MTYEKNRTAFVRYIPHLSKALPLERRIPNRQDFIHQKDFRFEVSSNAESQPHIHTTRVMLNGRVNKSFNLRKGHNFVELVVDLSFLHPENRTVQIDVFPSGQLRMKSSANLKQASNPSVQIDSAAGWFGYARQNL